jgi:glutamine cyclotransferase
MFEIATLDKKLGNYIDGVEINVKIISKGGELRQDLGAVTTEDGIYKSSITIPSMYWYAVNILSVTGEYYGVEKTIEKEFEVFHKKTASSECGAESNPFDVSDRDGQMTSITFNDDGSKMFLVGIDNAKVHEYKLCKNYSLGGISYTTSFSVSAKELKPHGIAFNSDGTKMFIVGQAGNDLNEYALSTAFDVSSASWSGNGCTEGQDGTKYSAVNFNADGTKVMILDNGDNTVREFVMSTAYSRANGDSGCDYNAANDSTDLNSLSGVSEQKPSGMAFNDDGTKMYIVGEQHDKVYELDLSTAYDVSEETFVASFDISDQENSPTGLEFSSDGKTMFVVGKNGDEINIYSLATAWSISTAQHK